MSVRELWLTKSCLCVTTLRATEVCVCVSVTRLCFIEVCLCVRITGLWVTEVFVMQQEYWPGSCDYQMSIGH